MMNSPQNAPNGEVSRQGNRDGGSLPSATASGAGDAAHNSVTNSLGAGATGNPATAAAERKGHAANAADGAPAAAASGAPRAVRGQPGASDGCAQPPARVRQPRRGGVVVGVAVTEGTASGFDESVGRAVLLVELLPDAVADTLALREARGEPLALAPHPPKPLA